MLSRSSTRIWYNDGAISDKRPTQNFKSLGKRPKHENTKSINELTRLNSMVIFAYVLPHTTQDRCYRKTKNPAPFLKFCQENEAKKLLAGWEATLPYSWSPASFIAWVNRSVNVKIQTRCRLEKEHWKWVFSRFHAGSKMRWTKPELKWLSISLVFVDEEYLLCLCSASSRSLFCFLCLKTLNRDAANIRFCFRANLPKDQKTKGMQHNHYFLENYFALLTYSWITAK